MFAGLASWWSGFVRPKSVQERSLRDFPIKKSFVWLAGEEESFTFGDALIATNSTGKSSTRASERKMLVLAIFPAGAFVILTCFAKAESGCFFRNSALIRRRSDGEDD